MPIPLIRQIVPTPNLTKISFNCHRLTFVGFSFIPSWLTSQLQNCAKLSNNKFEIWLCLKHLFSSSNHWLKRKLYNYISLLIDWLIQETLHRFFSILPSAQFSIWSVIINSVSVPGGGSEVYFHSSRQTVLFAIKVLQTTHSQWTSTCLYYSTTTEKKLFLDTQVSLALTHGCQM